MEPSDHPPGSWAARLDEALERPWVYIGFVVMVFGLLYLGLVCLK